MSIKKGTVTIASSTPATEWGSIEGTLADQQDLKNALDSKIPYLSPALTGTPTAPTAQVGTNTNQIATTKFVKSEIEDALQNVDLLPDQTGNDGKYLRTDGAVASWERVDALPDQTGQSGKVLTTNGTTASWTEYSPTPDVDGDTIHLNGDDELEAIGVIEKNAGAVKYDWVGTLAQWTAGRENHTIPDSWICYITDDHVESTVSHNIGDIFYSLRNEVAFNGAVVCDGSTYNIADYSSGDQSIKNLLDGGKLPYVSISDFDATVTANGSCRCFGYDGSTATIFKVPKLNDVFIESGIAANNSEFIEAGLPNITGKIEGSGNRTGFQSANGSFYTSDSGWGSGAADTTAQVNLSVNIDASRSSSIYGNSDTVQPNAVKYRAFIQLTTVATDTALQEVSEVIDDVNTVKQQIKETINYNNISNCILEIPQDIKLELNNGTLTLKAGSKIYSPNGFEQDGTTPKFDIINVTSDLTYSAGITTNWLLVINSTGSGLDRREMDHLYSGPTEPTGYTGTILWYDTTNNVIKKINNGTFVNNVALPLGIITGSGSISSIVQTFNGFGYIGSHVFALPGIRYLIPNGRNDDKTLKSIVKETIKISFADVVTTISECGAFLDTDGNIVTRLGYYSESNTAPKYTQYLIWYNEDENLMHRSADTGVTWDTRYLCYIGNYNSSDNKVSSFKYKSTFHALDYNDKSTISGLGMPSGKYVDLTLGANESTYTAPANGYYYLSCTMANAVAYVMLSSGGISNSAIAVSAGNTIKTWVPATSGATCTYNTNGTVSNVTFRFIYAEGEL